MSESAGQDYDAVLITGASSGIGEALARCFARNGHNLILVARSAAKLRALAATLEREHGVRAVAMPADLSMPNVPGRLALALEKRGARVDILVNNAGILEHGRFINMPAARHQELIALNVAAMTAMLAQFVPQMAKRGRGRVLNVASIAAFQPVPSLATYAATKAYVLSLTESLSEELRPSGVSVTALCPGITATGMVSTVQKDNPRLAQLPALLVGDTGEVAQQGYTACMRGEVIRVPGNLNLAATLAARATPKWLLRRISGYFGRESY